MTAQINLKELEKKAYTSTFQDGLLDIQFGILMLANAISAYVRYNFDPIWSTLTYLVISLFGVLLFLLCKLS